tara:strand:+ start:317 stop:1501 length:1185 start_codon:yes stop_codon:yes gene_type:complete
MKKSIIYLFVLPLILGIFTLSCKNKTENKPSVKEETITESSFESILKKKNFDTIIDQKKVGLYWIKNKDVTAAFTNYGGRIIGLWVPDKNQKMTDVVVGFGSIKDYLNSTEPYFGATIGRVGNRIAKGKFTLKGKEYSIPINNGENSLHGGKKGFQDVVWDVEQSNEKTIVFRYTSLDMEEGFPGTLSVKVTYTATENNSILMEYEATTDKSSVVNLTNHAFFNLNGEGSGTILNHVVQIYADKFTPVDSGLIPTGELRPVKGTPFDFTEPHTIGERIEVQNEQLKNGEGYDHNFVLNETKENGFNKVAKFIGDTSKIVMTVYTQEPGVQFYSGNFMQAQNTFKTGVKDNYRTAFALETQHFPDAPNQPSFPSIVLNPDEKYSTISEYFFSVED